MEDFYELELNIKGLNNLEESMNDYFSEEALDGENQYFCESCQKRVDATRCIKLRSLPPVVNFQLKRYVFLPKVIYLNPKLIHFTFLLSCVLLPCPRIYLTFPLPDNNEEKDFFNIQFPRTARYGKTVVKPFI